MASAQVVGTGGGPDNIPANKEDCNDKASQVMHKFYSLHDSASGKKFKHEVHPLVGSIQDQEVRDYLDTLVVKYQQYVLQKVKNLDVLERCGLKIQGDTSRREDKIKKMKAFKSELLGYQKNKGACQMLILSDSEKESYGKILDAIIDLNSQ
jgi:hypothetical protein